MGSPDNSFAREAVRQLRSRGWLTDGTTREVYLIGADLRKANLVSPDLSGADLKYAKLNKADLIGANLSVAKLVFIDLSRVNLALADLGGANLALADLSETNLVKADLSEAIHDEDTKWPEGFYPEEAGAKLLENIIAGQKWAEENLSKLREEDEQKQDE